MKLAYSLLSRRRFLNWLGGGTLGSLMASLIYPLLKTAIPPYREPDEVVLPLAEYSTLAPNTVKTFSWGIQPGIIKKNRDGNLEAFVGVCTHLDCNVQYLPEQRKFYCPCHQGWYDENGVNIAGPPPRPLRRLFLFAAGDNLVVRKEAKGAEG